MSSKVVSTSQCVFSAAGNETLVNGLVGVLWLSEVRKWVGRGV